ncbi:MAG TPA: hypothetical protein VJZ94_02935 [Candidatus Paceibacterota bacterium]|nr:hypothetical protein [Candidatus Paceibacterota bacterium]
MGEKLTFVGFGQSVLDYKKLFCAGGRAGTTAAHIAAVGYVENTISPVVRAGFAVADET